MPDQEHHYLKPNFESGYHTSSLFQPPSPHSKSVSSLTVDNKEKPLLCEGEETISIQYTFVGEAAGTADLMYLVSSEGMLTLTLQFQRFYPSALVTNSPRFCHEGKSSLKESKMWRF